MDLVAERDRLFGRLALFVPAETEEQRQHHEQGEIPEHGGAYDSSCQRYSPLV